MSKRLSNSRTDRHNGPYGRQAPKTSRAGHRRLLKESREAMNSSVGLSPEFKNVGADLAAKIRRMGMQTSRRGS